MFEGGRGGGGGVPDQFRHFIASRSSISLPISFTHHGVAAVVSSPPLPLSFGGAGFESYPPPAPPAAALFPPPSHHHHQQHHSDLLQSSKTTAAEDLKEEAIISSSRRLLGTNNLVLQERERSIIIPAVVSSSPPSSDHSSIEASSSWTNDEVLALLRIRSSMENWFPDFTWEHVSRKLAELGFQRSAEKCKEKFEEESRNFSTNYSSRFLVSDLDEQVLYNHDDDENNPQVSSSPAAAEKAQDHNNNNNKDNNLAAKERNDYEKELVQEEGNAAVAIGNKACNEEQMILMCRKRKKKRKRAEEKEEKEEEEFEMFKGFCESIVRKIIGQQEELHNKLIEDMIRRDEESIAREEAWRIQEIDRINKEIEKRSREQAVSGDRQAKIIDFFKKFMATSEVISPSPHHHHHHHHQEQQDEEVDDHNNLVLIKNKFQDLLLKLTNPSNTKSPNINTSNNPTSSSTSTENTVPSPPPHHHHHHDHISHGSISTPKETSTSKIPNEGGERDTSTGKRWPRDEVLALINLRCSLNNNNNNNEDNKDAGGSSSSTTTTTTKGNGSPALPLWERISQMMLELGYQRSAKRCKEKWENINKYFRKTKDSKKKRSMDSRTCPYFHQLSNLYSQAAGGTPLVGSSLNH